jgi:hypothetical protein
MNKAALVYKTLMFVSSCCFFIILLTAHAAAQTRGRVEVVKDSRIDTLIARRHAPKKAGGFGNAYSTFGYRVQFFSGSNRREAFRAQEQFQEMYPEYRTYISYKEPNFKVKAGDFRSRLEASKLMQQLRSQFSSLFILSERINPPLNPVPENND